MTTPPEPTVDLALEDWRKWKPQYWMDAGWEYDVFMAGWGASKARCNQAGQERLPQMVDPWVLGYQFAQATLRSERDHLRSRLALAEQEHWPDPAGHCLCFNTVRQTSTRNGELRAEITALRKRLVLAEQALEAALGEITDLEVDRERLHQDIDAQLAVVEAARAWYRDFTDRDAWIVTGAALARLDETMPVTK